MRYNETAMSMTTTQVQPDISVRTRDSGEPPARRGGHPALRFALFAAAAIFVIVSIIALVRWWTETHTAPRYISAPAAYADVQASVQETGTVNPVDQVQVGTQVSGTVASIAADYNDVVHKGQILAVIDPTNFQAAATQAEAQLGAASANAMQMQANVTSAQANYLKAKSQLTLSERTLSRDKQLLGQGYIPQSQYDTDAAANQANVDSAAAASAGIDAARQQLAAAQAQTTAAGGQAESANYNLTRTIIRSPIDGIVVSRNISVGQTVAASFQTPTLYLIASTLRNMQIDTSVGEADVGDLKVGQSATITVPAYPNISFRGKLNQIRINPIVTNNVVTYDAIIGVGDQTARLKPGMTANVAIHIANRSHVLTVPTAALLYRPAQSQGQNAATAAVVAGAPGSRATLWVLRRGKASQVSVTIGYSDDTKVEIRSGELKAGDRVILGTLQQQAPRTINGFGPARG
jgi:HlyD family secretion protein